MSINLNRAKRNTKSGIHTPYQSQNKRVSFPDVSATGVLPNVRSEVSVWPPKHVNNETATASIESRASVSNQGCKIHPELLKNFSDSPPPSRVVRPDEVSMKIDSRSIELFIQRVCMCLYPPLWLPKKHLSNETSPTLEAMQRAEDLTRWIGNKTVTGHKLEAAKSILWAYSNTGTALKLAGLEFTSLPPIGPLRSLHWLNLSDNQLTTLSPEIGQLSGRYLYSLYLSDNQLTTLPPEIGGLTMLVDFRLDNNQLTTLPPEIGKLTSLREFWIGKNYLTEADMANVPAHLRGEVIGLRDQKKEADFGKDWEENSRKIASIIGMITQCKEAIATKDASKEGLDSRPVSVICNMRYVNMNRKLRNYEKKKKEYEEVRAHLKDIASKNVTIYYNREQWNPVYEKNKSLFK